MLNYKSNIMCNNILFNSDRIDSMHKQMERLYQAAKVLKEITGQSELARALNASPQTVKNWESRGISSQGLLTAQKIIGCSAVWLETGNGSMQASKINHIIPLENNIEELPSQNRVPLISWVAAGKWCNVSNPYEAGDAEDWIICPVKHSTKTYALKVKGDSMHNPGGKPSFDDGDIIFVDPERNFDHRSYVIVRLDDENQATFKRLLIDGNRRMLEALNPAWPNRIFEINEDATICGVVIARLESFA